MKKSTTIFVILGFAAFISCSGGGAGTTSVGNSSTSTTTSSVTIGQLTSAGTSRIEIPLAVFGGDESDLSGATIAIYKNGTLSSASIVAEDYYIASSEVVRFDYASLSDGDLLTLVIAASDGESLSFAGLVSESADSEAVSQAAPEELLSDANLTLQVLDEDTLEIGIALSVYGDSEADLDGTSATVLLAEASGTALGSTVTSVADNYDSASGDVILEISGPIAETESLTIVVSNPDGGEGLAFEPEIGDALGVWESDTVLYRRGFVGTGTAEREVTFAISESYRTASDDCPAALVDAYDVTDMNFSQDSGRLIFIGGADDDRDWEGTIDDDGSFILLDGQTSTDGATVYSAVNRFDGTLTDDGISGTNTIYYETPTLTCRVEIGFTGTPE